MQLKTKLKNRLELFELLVIARFLRLPILFIGAPGTGKSQSITEFLLAIHGLSKFFLQCDMGMSPLEVRGRIDMQELLVNKKYMVDCPIALAKLIYVDEIDKASAEIRNLFLSLMRERVIKRDGIEIPCEWELFAGSINEYDSNETTPFYDRFAFKYKVQRLDIEQLTSALREPEEEQIELNTIDPQVFANNRASLIDNPVFMNFIKIIYPHISDRTAFYLPSIVAAVMSYYDCSDIDGIMKAVKFMFENHSKLVNDNLIPAEVRQALSALDNIKRIRSKPDRLKALAGFEVPSVPSSMKTLIQHSINEIKKGLTK